MAFRAVQHPTSIIEMRADATEHFCPVIHQVDKRADTAGYMNRDGVAGIVCGMDKRTIDQIFKQEGLAGRNLSIRRTDVQSLEDIRLRGNLIIQIHAPGFHCFHRQQARHNLGKARDGVKLIFVDFIQNGIGVHVYYKYGISTLEMRRFHRIGRGGKTRQQQTDCQ